MLVILVGPYAGQLVVFAHVFSHSVSQVCFAGLFRGSVRLLRAAE